MAIEFTDGKYVDENGRVTLDPTVYKDWQIAEEAEKALDIEALVDRCTLEHKRFKLYQK